MSRKSLQNVPQITVVKNAKAFIIFQIVQKFLRLIIKTVIKLKIFKTVNIKTYIKMIIKQPLPLQIV